MSAARLTMRWQREQFAAMVRQAAGPRWTEEASRETIPFNFLSLYQRIVLRSLVSQEPRVMLSTDSQPDKPAVSTMETWFNKYIQKIHLADTLQFSAQSALYGMGIIKTGVADPGVAAAHGWGFEAGQPYAKIVDFDDWVWDIHARHPEECTFQSHRMRVPLDTVRDSSRYTKARKDLQPSTDPRFNKEGDQRLNVLGRGYYGADEEVRDMIDIWEVYCPQDNCILTLADDALVGITAPSHGGKPMALLEQRYIGPDDGPYSILFYDRVVGNLPGKGPMQDLLDLHLPLNNIGRKLIRQAHNQKHLTICRKGADGDMKRIEEADDQMIVPLDNPQDVQQIDMGGPNQLMFQFMIQLKEIFSWFAGNLDVMGGLSPQGRTATQENLLAQNSSSGIADMQIRVVAHTTNVIEKLLWWHWHHPRNVMRAPLNHPDFPDLKGMPRELHPWTQASPGRMARTGNWEDIDIKIDPYSLTHTTPQQRAQALQQVITQVYMPLATVAQQQGDALDMGALLEKMGKYLNMPDLPEIIRYQEPPQDQEADESGGDVTQPSPQTTTHVRENMPGRTSQGDSMNRMNSLAGINVGGNPETTKK